MLFTTKRSITILIKGLLGMLHIFKVPFGLFAWDSVHVLHGALVVFGLCTTSLAFVDMFLSHSGYHVIKIRFLFLRL